MKKILTKLRHSIGILTTFKEEEVGLFIPNKQVSWLVATLIGIAFVCFALGYFWGHRRALERFVAKIEEESFADRINYALYTMNDRDMSEFEQDPEDTNGTAPIEEVSNGDDQEEVIEEQEMSSDESTTKKESEKVQEPASQCIQNNTPEEIASSTTVFVAPLAGFGTLHAATDFLKRVQLIDPASVIEKKVSKTSKKRSITWYQVITGEFDTKEDLEKFLSVIKKREHIKNIEIMEKRKG
jgi:hypothetical protein